MDDIYASVEERLTAYISPRKPRSERQKSAFEEAVNVQVEHEQSAGATGIPGGIASFSIGDFSATMTAGASSAAYTQATLSPHTWAILFNAGLIPIDVPTARRI